MAALQTIRSRGGVLVGIIIGLALIAFIVGDALSSGSTIFGHKTEVGIVDGQSLSIIDYQNKIKRRESILQVETGSTSLNDTQQKQLREQIWQEMISDIIMGQEYSELGLSVESDEMYQLVYGENISPVVAKIFTDPTTGKVDKNKARQTIKAIIESPSNNMYKLWWIQKEKEIKSNRLMTKYGSLLSNAGYITDAELDEKANEQAVKVDISYIMKGYNTVADSAVSVSKSEVKDYYEKHIAKYQQDESREILYVNFPIVPSLEDNDMTKKAIEKLIPEFSTTTTPGEFVNLSCDKKFDFNYYSKDEIKNDDLANFLFAKKDSVFGPYEEKGFYMASRAIDYKSLPDSVRIRHILLPAEQGKDIETLRPLADSLANAIRKGADFEKIAATYSKDQQSAINGGDLGWFTQSALPKTLADAAFFSKKNEIKVVKTAYGFHIVQRTGMTTPKQKVQYATLTKEIMPSNKTINNINNKARIFASKIVTLDDFNDKVEKSNLTKRSAKLGKNDESIAGLKNCRELIREAYLTEDAKQIIKSSDGTVIFDNGSAYTVAVLANINEKGNAPIASVSPSIYRILKNKKKGEIIKKELAKNIKGSNSLASIAQKSGVNILDANDVTFSSLQLKGSGLEPNVVATATNTKQGVITGPIAGNNGIFVIVVNNIRKDSITKEELAKIKASLIQDYGYRVAYQAIPALLKEANIVDSRYKFY